MQTKELRQRDSDSENNSLLQNNNAAQSCY